MNQPALRLEHVSKKFARSLKRAMVYGLTDMARMALMPQRYRSPGLDRRIGDAAGTPLPALHPADLERDLRATEFWAVKDVSFTLERGECLGIIGHNGAGKSTIFKMLSGIFAPTYGRIEQRGNLSALIEVGAGFHPMLSGRENIFISGAIRGMSTEEINRKYESIVEFSGVRDFIDMPIKFYSSGMHVRLGFAVLAHLEPEILLIDEILAVGDLAFQRKCIEHINRMRESDMAIAFVSHSLYRVESLCHRVIWMDHGQVRLEGSADEVIRAYRDHEIKARDGEAPREGVVVENDNLRILGADILDGGGTVTDEIGFGDPIRVRLRYEAKRAITKPRFNFAFLLNGVRLFETSMLIDGRSPERIEGPGEVTVTIPRPALLPKKYEVQLFMNTEEGAVYLVEPIVVTSFVVTSAGLDGLPTDGPYALGHLMAGGAVYFDYTWDLEKARLT